jgi:hypothetical protein
MSQRGCGFYNCDESSPICFCEGRMNAHRPFCPGPCSIVSHPPKTRRDGAPSVVVAYGPASNSGWRILPISSPTAASLEPVTNARHDSTPLARTVNHTNVPAVVHERATDSGVASA